MNSSDANAELRRGALAWLEEDPDPVTADALRALLEQDDVAALSDAFGARLEFGTAGLRGVLGPGPNRMNRSVVIRTAAGLCAYLTRTVPDAAQRGLVIGYDGRRNSRRFAEDTAEVCAGFGVTAYLFPTLGPTPLLAFAVTELGCAAGVMVTASHNPPEYNGYKVYGGDGAQIVPPVDRDIAAAIDAVGPLVTVARPILKEARGRGLVRDVPTEVEAKYLDAVYALGQHPGVGADLVIAYTPLHGVGHRLARMALARAGFAHVHAVAEQAEPDEAFSTVAFPNPEEKGAMDLVLALAARTGAELVIANDPDADRLAVATRTSAGGYVQLTGNEVGALLGYYTLVDDPRPPSGPGERLVVTTIVSSPLLGALARSVGARYEETLTGFKWISHRAIDVERESGARFVFGYEEALGYTVGTAVRDKDGIGAARVFAELAGYYRDVHGRSVLEQLDEVYRRVGVFVSGQHNVTLKGLDGASRIATIMDGFRASPPARVGDAAVATVTDVLRGERWRPEAREASREKLALPPSNVIAYGLEDGSRITLRPSGTEPKIKYYFDIREPVRDGEPVDAARARAKTRLAALTTAFVALADAYG
ncbi:MAG: phospho-sugar mutase [Deltaproteobacteria bacterium]